MKFIATVLLGIGITVIMIIDETIVSVSTLKDGEKPKVPQWARSLAALYFVITRGAVAYIIARWMIKWIS